MCEIDEKQSLEKKNNEQKLKRTKNNQQLPNSNSECKQNSTWIRLESKYSKLK